LNAPPRKDVRARTRHGRRGRFELLARLDAARSGANCDRRAAERDAVADADDAALGARFTAHELVAARNRHDGFDAVEVRKLREQRFLVGRRADDADDRALRALADVGREGECVDQRRDARQFRFGDVRPHHDDH
jgi:hypothetical protein